MSVFAKRSNKILDSELASAATRKENLPVDHIFVKSNGKFFKVNFSEIVYIEGMRDYIKIHTRERRIVTLQTMNEMEKILPSKEFMRVHKSYIIALANIKSIYGNDI